MSGISATEDAASRPGLSMTGRRVLFGALVAVTTLALIWLMAATLSPGGLSAVDVAILVLFGFTLPWLVIGFWNAAIGYLLMQLSADYETTVVPAASRIHGNEAIMASTAILVCIRNEMPDRAIRNLKPALDGLIAAGVGDRFHAYILSDTSDVAVASSEDSKFAALAAQYGGRIAIAYRRRMENTGFKAGNIRDFCDRWGAQHHFMLVLDTDSVMTANAILRLVRIMQANPSLGILQSLVVGLPSSSAFARLFQFGMRLGMRSYTAGSAWWQGDCGPYWGHNAIVRIAPFVAHCGLPAMPKGSLLGDQVLSHDQIEAALMRRAGYEVRVLAKENGSFEENPPTLVEFIRRDLRWCQGNMQYVHFLNLPELKPVSRYQLLFAILMFAGSPAWIGLLILGTMLAASAQNIADVIRPWPGLALYLIVLAMWMSPKLATILHVLPRASAREAFGGTLLFTKSIVCEAFFFILLMPIMWFRHTVFLIGLLFGKQIGWVGQTRDDHAVPWSLAAQTLWPQTLLGIAVVAVLSAAHPWANIFAFFVAGGLALSIPLAVLTSLPQVGRRMTRLGIGRLPEETAPPRELRDLGLPALESGPAAPGTSVPEAFRTACGVARSLRIYYRGRPRRAAMDDFYRRFVTRGTLTFDVGAHVGDRVGSFRRLGATVVAVEPQPALAATLKLIYGRDRSVTIERVAVGRRGGSIELKINAANPTISTASDAFISASQGAPGWQGQHWDRTIAVPMTTLDALIARHGMPSFLKIDVEGFEAEALAGLSAPVPALSFEFTTIQRDVATQCVDRCAALGYAKFNAVLGEGLQFQWATDVSAGDIKRWIASLPAEANSGDIYASL